MTATIKVNSIVAGSARPEQVSAQLYGQWAVHAGVGEDAKSWTVTHVKSGFAVRRGIRTKRRAQAVARALQAEHPDAFSGLSFGQKPSPDQGDLVRACQQCIESALAGAAP